MKIAISGTYSTGKTTTALALSYLTGIPCTHASTMREILPITFPGKRLENCESHELMELGIRRYFERCISESKYNNHFISDGCAFQEWIYGTTRLEFGLNPNEHQLKIKWNKISKRNKYKVFKKSMEAMGVIAKQHVKNNYDILIHLPVEFPFEADGHRPVKEKFREKSEELLIETYKACNINYFNASGTLAQRLKKIVEKLELPNIMSINEAISMANNKRISNFDNIKIESKI
jgi:hypothetical protein